MAVAGDRARVPRRAAWSTARAERGERLPARDARHRRRRPPLGELGIGTNSGIDRPIGRDPVRREDRRHGAPGARAQLSRDGRHQRVRRPLGPDLRPARRRAAERRRRDGAARTGASWTNSGGAAARTPGTVGLDMDVKAARSWRRRWPRCRFASPAGAAPGDLDPSFSTDGRVSPLRARARSCRAPWRCRPDGRIVVAGSSCDPGTCGPTGGSSFRLARYTADGGLDPEFGDNGLVTTPIGRAARRLRRARTPDGRIVAGGVASVAMADPGSFALARYHARGRADPAFGSGGRRCSASATASRPSPTSCRARRSVLAVGQASPAGAPASRSPASPRMARRTPRFGIGGSLSCPPAPYGYGLGRTLLPDGRIVAAGASGESPAAATSASAASPAVSAGDFGPLRLRRGRRVLVLRQRRVALADGRVLSAGAATVRDGRPAMALARPARTARRPGVRTAPAPCSSAPASARPPTTSARARTAARWPPAIRAPARLAFVLARLDGAGELDRSFGDAGRACSRPSRARRSRARRRSRRQADGRSSPPASRARSGSGAQCGAARCGSRSPATRAATRPRRAARRRPARRPPAPAGARRSPSLPSRLRARRGRHEGSASAAARPNASAAGSHAAAAHGRRALLLDARSVSVPGTAPAAVHA